MSQYLLMNDLIFSVSHHCMHFSCWGVAAAKLLTLECTGTMEGVSTCADHNDLSPLPSHAIFYSCRTENATRVMHDPTLVMGNYLNGIIVLPF
jgi:hypothetical protein